MCGVFPAKGDQYTTTGVYTFSDSSDNTYQLPMPEQEFYNHSGSGVVSNTLVMGATQYTISQEIKYENAMNNSYLASTVITGTRQGWLDSYAQRFTYVNSSSDRYRLYFNISENRGGSGTVTVSYQKNDNWVQFGEYEFDGTYSGEFYVREITGYRVEVRYTLTSRFAFARADDAYTDGYKLNDFGMNIESSKDYQEQALDNIQDLQRETNGILQNTLDDLANIPHWIGNVLEELFLPSDDFMDDLTSNAEDLLDSLGVLGYPIDFYLDVMETVHDTSTESMPVEIPAFYWQGRTIFPRYYRSDIFYFKDIQVFQNVQKTTWLRNLFGTVGIDIDTVTVGQFVHKVMTLVLFFGFLGLAIRYFNDIFGTEVAEDAEEEESEE